MEFDMKAETLKDGLIMYCAEKEDGNKDFASLAIKNGKLEFQFDTGSGTYFNYRMNSNLCTVGNLTDFLIIHKKFSDSNHILK